MVNKGKVGLLVAICQDYVFESVFSVREERTFGRKNNTFLILKNW